MDGIRQAALFAHGLKEPRTRVLAEDGVEEAQGETAFVVARTGADAERELGLFGGLGEEPDGGFALVAGRGRERGPFAGGEARRVLRDGFHHLPVLDMSGGDDERAAADVVGPQVIEKVRTLQSVKRLLGAGERAAERLIGPEGFVKQFLDVEMRLVEIHRQLLFDDVAFLGDVAGRAFRVEKHIRQHVEQFVEPVVARTGIKTGVLLAGEGVEITADAFDVLGNLPGRTLARAFENASRPGRR